MIDWAGYRSRYDRMSYNEVAAFHRDVWAAYPEQRQGSLDHLITYFADLSHPSVIEVGGWRGDAAATLLAQRPDIVRWDNYEVCEPAVRAPATKDPRYRAVFPDRWTWELDVPERHDTAVLSHVIEHVRAVQLRALIDWLRGNGVRDIFVEAPIGEQGRDWRGYCSAHVLELGIPEVIDLFADLGYRLRARAWHPPESHVFAFEASA